MVKPRPAHGGPCQAADDFCDVQEMLCFTCGETEVTFRTRREIGNSKNSNEIADTADVNTSTPVYNNRFPHVVPRDLTGKTFNTRLMHTT